MDVIDDGLNERRGVRFDDRVTGKFEEFCKHGTIVLLESLGTGNEEPVRLEHVESTYQWLDANDFQNKWIRTDYKFDSLEEAIDLSRFFFGDELGAKVERNQWVILPECTGVWWKRIG